MFNLLPHELALGRRDGAGDDIEMDAIVFDVQCAMAYGEQREEAAKKAAKRRR